MEIKEFTSDIIQNITNNRIEKIIIDPNYNSTLPDLPDTIKIIIFGDRDIDFVNIYEKNCDFDSSQNIKFNQPLDNLPINLTHLIFFNNSDFSQSLDYLPKNLKYLAIGNSYNKPLNNLPENLIYLYFKNYSYDYDFNHLPSKFDLRLEFSDTTFLYSLYNSPNENNDNPIKILYFIVLDILL